VGGLERRPGADAGGVTLLALLWHHPAMTHRATGTFEVTMERQPPYETADGVTLARTGLEKRFAGDLVASSTGEMLSAMTSVKGSAGYVAIERVTGTLEGRTGSFVLQHSGTMTRGAPSLMVSVVPDSGTGGLAGLSGTMTIDIVDGKHKYGFDYALDGG
jgi:hypothetical protein